MSFGSSTYDIDTAQAENRGFNLQWSANKHFIWFIIIGILLLFFFVMKRFFK